MELKGNIKTFYARSEKAWRTWLENNHASEKSVWLIIYKKGTGIPSVYYPEAVTQALCFGWIDSKANKRDGESYFQFFTKRNPKSNWSKINKEKVEYLLSSQLMAQAGIEMIRIAKETGTWYVLDEVELLLVPADMQKAFKKNKPAFNNWELFSHSTRRGILEWILNARTAATRNKRIEETITLAAKNIKANQYNKKDAGPNK